MRLKFDLRAICLGVVRVGEILNHFELDVYGGAYWRAQVLDLEYRVVFILQLTHDRIIQGEGVGVTGQAYLTSFGP